MVRRLPADAMVVPRDGRRLQMGRLGTVMLPIKAIDTVQPIYGHTAFAPLIVLRGRCCRFLCRPLSRMGRFRPTKELQHGRPNRGW